MKAAIVFFALVAAAVAFPQGSPESHAQVLHNDVDNIGLNEYNYGYDTSNGISAQEHGQVVNPGSENEALVARGQYSYTGPDGVQYLVNYVADENGFHPQGAHLPVA